MPAAAKSPRTLSQFAGLKTRLDCTVCTALPPELRKQIRDSNRKLVPFRVVLEWLKREHGVNAITLAELRGHARANHDLDL